MANAAEHFSPAKVTCGKLPLPNSMAEMFLEMRMVFWSMLRIFLIVLCTKPCSGAPPSLKVCFLLHLYFRLLLRMLKTSKIYFAWALKCVQLRYLIHTSISYNMQSRTIQLLGTSCCATILLRFPGDCSWWEILCSASTPFTVRYDSKPLTSRIYIRITSDQ